MGSPIIEKIFPFAENVMKKMDVNYIWLWNKKTIDENMITFLFTCKKKLQHLFCYANIERWN